MTKELEGLEEDPKVEIHIYLLKTTLKNHSKTPGHDGIHESWFKKFISIHDRLALEMNRCLQRALKKDHIDPEGATQGNRPKQLQTHNLSTDDVENIDSTNKGRYSLLANKSRIVPWGTERMLQRIRRYKRVTLYKSAHPKRGQNQTEKSSYGQDWLQSHMI